MDEMQLLRHFGDDVEIDPAALRRVRHRLLQRALSQPACRRVAMRRRLLVGAAAALVAATALMMATSTVRGGGAEASAARVLDRAAESVGAPVVGQSQWTHVRYETTRWDDQEVERTVQESWIPGDQDRRTRFRDFEGLVYVRPLDIPSIARDPHADSDMVYAWLARDSGDLTGAEAAFERAGETLSDDAIPAAFKAMLFEAIKQIDGTRIVSASEKFAGHDAVLLGRSDVGLQTQLAFDRTSGVFLGSQGVVVDSGELHYQTFITTRVVDSLPRRATTCLAIGNEVDGYHFPPGCDPM